MSRFKKIFKIFDKNEKTKFIFILILSVFGAFLEMIGISSFIPLIAILLGESINFAGSNILNNYVNLINQFNYENILVLVVTILVLIFLIKNIYLFF